MLKIGKQRKVDAEQLEAAAVEADSVAAPDRRSTRAAVIAQLGRLGQPVSVVTGQGE